LQSDDDRVLARVAELRQHPGDSQRVELLGRNRLIDELLRDDLEIALPIRDRGIDLIAYVDLSESVSRYVARPVQMKASWTRAFGIDRKYAKFPGLLIAYVWNLNSATDAVTYALDYGQACTIAEKLGWTRTASWEKGGYSSSAPSKQLLESLEPHRITPGAWWKLVVASPTVGAASLGPNEIHEVPR
jgi:hypothetical protein